MGCDNKRQLANGCPQAWAPPPTPTRNRRRGGEGGLSGKGSQGEAGPREKEHYRERAQRETEHYRERTPREKEHCRERTPRETEHYRERAQREKEHYREELRARKGTIEKGLSARMGSVRNGLRRERAQQGGLCGRWRQNSVAGGGRRVWSVVRGRWREKTVCGRSCFSRRPTLSPATTCTFSRHHSPGATRKGGSPRGTALLLDLLEVHTTRRVAALRCRGALRLVGHNGLRGEEQSGDG